MGEHIQVTFRFGPDLEVRYLERLPSPGDRVVHDGKPWVVTNVESDSAGPVVNSRRARDVVRAARVHAVRMRDVGARQREVSAKHRESAATAAARAAALQRRREGPQRSSGRTPADAERDESDRGS